MDKININVNSEIGELEAVLIHKPGPEIENMIPKNVERALYSDILNLSVATFEYDQFETILRKTTNVLVVKDLLKDVLSIDTVKNELINNICNYEDINSICDLLLDKDPESLATILIEGLTMEKDTLTKYLDQDRYSLKPLHNFFFMRDASTTVYNKVFISKMANKVRMREAKIMQAIFMHHPLFIVNTVSTLYQDTLSKNISYEGGDLIVFKDDILIIGLSQRTSSQGIDFIIDQLKADKKKRHIIVQELPHNPESFIHLDMTFTSIDVDKCMVYKPLIVDANHYSTIHITIDNGAVKSIEAKNNILEILKELKVDVEPVLCGGDHDPYSQEREQWHSGANFFSIAPGKILGYNRNIYTLEALNKAGFEILEAEDIIGGTKNIDDYSKYVVAFEGSELSRGGGGARCMTMPLKRKPVNW